MSSDTYESSDRIDLSASAKDNITVVQPYSADFYVGQIVNFYQSLALRQTDLLEFTVKHFLGQPYFLEPLGEGSNGKYSQEPLYRTDKFDCVSYVDTVLALLNAKNLTQFEENILLIRYGAAQALYSKRTDWFTDLEWIPVARRAGWIRDVTRQIVDEHQQAVALTAKTLIDKPNWYKVRPLKIMHLFAPLPDDGQANDLLAELRSEGERFISQTSELAYLPLAKLFHANGSVNDYMFAQIPSGSVVAIVRPDWQIRDVFPGFPYGYGTNLNVSHMGIVIREGTELMFYNASSLHKKVECEPLRQYLQKYLDSPTIKGIHVEQIIF